MKLPIGKVLCLGDSLEVAEAITLSLIHYGQPLGIIDLGIKFCLSILFCKNSRGVLCAVVGIMACL